MKAVWFSVSALFLYAIANVLLEQKFSKYNNLTVIVCYASVTAVAALAMRQVTKTEDLSYAFPSGWNFALVALLGLIFLAADYFYIGAYTNGGSLLTITSIMVMFPVVASLIKFVWVKGVPNIWQISGYLVAIVAVLLIAKGGTIKPS